MLCEASSLLGREQTHREDDGHGDTSTQMCEALIHLVESTLNVSAYAARFPLTKRTDAAAADADAAEAQLTYFATGTCVCHAAP